MRALISGKQIAIACAVVGSLTGNADAESIDLRLRAIPLHTENQTQTRAGQLEFLAGYVLTSPDPRFGGYSGLTLRRQGTRLIAVSDRGHWLSADMVVDGEGRLNGLRSASITPLRDGRGRAVKIRDALHDAEAVEQLDDGSLAVSFERRHRIWRYTLGKDLATGNAKPLVTGKTLTGLRLNGGIEAMTALGNGRMLLVAEDSYDDKGNHKGWLWQQSGATPLKLRA